MTTNSNEHKGPGRHLVMVLFALAAGLGFTASAAFAAIPSGTGAASQNAGASAQGGTATLTIGIPTETITVGLPTGTSTVGLPTGTSTIGLPTGTATVGLPTGTSTIGLPTGTSTVGLPTGTMTAIATGTSTVMASGTVVGTGTSTVMATGTGTVVATATCAPGGGQTYTNPAPITLSATGTAVPYPAPLVVAGGPTSITDVNVTFNGIHHTWPDDVDMLLVGPGGQNAIIWSDAGGSLDILTATVTLDDEAPVVLPDASQISTGSYQPANYVTGDTFPAPAPAPSGGSALSVFDGTNANGTWSLYIVDDITGQSGMINGGWTLTFNSTGGGCPTPSVVTTGTTTSTVLATMTRTASVVASTTTTAGTATRTASVVASMTRTGTASVVPSMTRTASVVASMTVGTSTVLPSMTRTGTAMPSMTGTAMPSMTRTAMPSMTRTAMPSMTMTSMPSMTRTAMPSMTGTAMVTRTAVPCNGRVTICHRTGNGNSHTITVSCNALPAHMRHGDTVGPCPAATPRPRGNNFRDISTSDYFYEHVLDLRDANAVGGYNDNTFRPYNQATRAQLVKIVVLAFEIPLYNGNEQQFTDVPTSHPFYHYIMTAWRDNIITGYSDGTFRPYANVTRGQIAKIAVESARMEDLSANGPSFTDVPTDHTFYRYIETAYANGILNGYADNTFRPFADATRGQITKIVNLATHEEPAQR